MAKKTPVNAPKKPRVIKTRDINDVAKISQVLYSKKIPFKISVKTYAVGEAVKFIFNVDPITDEKREEVMTAIRN